MRLTFTANYDPIRPHGCFAHDGSGWTLCLGRLAVHWWYK